MKRKQLYVMEGRLKSESRKQKETAERRDVVTAKHIPLSRGAPFTSQVSVQGQAHAHQRSAGASTKWSTTVINTIHFQQQHRVVGTNEFYQLCFHAVRIKEMASSRDLKVKWEPDTRKQGIKGVDRASSTRGVSSSVYI